MNSNLVWVNTSQAVALHEPLMLVRERHICYEQVLLLYDQPCAYDAATGEPLAETFLTRGLRRHTFRFPFAKRVDPHGGNVEREFSDAIYIPFFNSHFGHLLTESLAHSWHAFDPSPQAAAAEDLIIQNVKGRPEGHLIDQLRKRYRVSFASELPGRTRVQRLHCAVPTLIFGYGMSARHCDEVENYVSRIIGPAKLLALQRQKGRYFTYVSRQALEPRLRHLLGEERLVAALRRLGWRILDPQLLPLAEQLQAYAESTVIAGNLASAFHLLMAFGKASKNLQQKTVIALTGAQIPRTYVLQFMVQGIQCQFMRCLTPVPCPADQVAWPTLIDQELCWEPEQVAEAIHSRASSA